VNVTTHFPKASYVPGAAHAFCAVAGGPPLESGNFHEASRKIPHRTHVATSCVRRPIAFGTMPASSRSESGFAMAFMIDLAFTSAAILDE
jgi:hypothetical protein